MARFFLEGTTVTDVLTISGDDARHIARVLRMQPGERIELVIAHRGYQASLLTVSSDLVTARLEAPLPLDSESPLEIHLYQALPKSDKMDLIVQKATELGVAAITPVLTARVVVKLAERSGGQRVERWRRIAAEAAKQSRRTVIPTVCAPVQLETLPANPQRLRLVAWEQASQPLSVLLAGQTGCRGVDLLIGPEGGLSSQEVARLEQQGWQCIGLGPRILRTETAPLALLAILQYQLGDLGGMRACRG